MSRPFPTLVLLWLLALLPAACAAPGTPPPVQDGAGGEAVLVPPLPVPGARTAPQPLPGRLLLPDGPGPHPVVIVLHGCGGVGRNQGLWAERLRDWGYGSLVLDSLGPRGVSSVCAADRQPLVTRYDRAGDAIAAARFLQTVPGVDGKRIAVLGGSHGGATAATLALAPYEAAAPGLIRGAVDYYGACRQSQQHGRMPLLALAGEDDTWSNPAASCRSYAATVGTAQDITVQTYPGTVHAFDNPALIQRRASEGHAMQYNPSAAEDSFTRVRAFLDRVLKQG